MQSAFHPTLPTLCVLLYVLPPTVHVVTPPPAGALSDDAVWRLSVVCLSDVCLSRTSGLSREQRPRKTKIGTQVAHVTRDSDTTFKVKRSKVKVTRPLYSPPCWRVRRLQWWAFTCGRGKLLLRCRLLGGARRFGAHGRGEGRGHILAAARLQPVTPCFYVHFSHTVSKYSDGVLKWCAVQ